MRGRTFPGLSTTRSLGDLLAHHIGVTSEPNFSMISMHYGHKEHFLVVATDGIWDILTPEEVVESIQDHGRKYMGAGTEYVVGKAKDRCALSDSRLDDMTIIVSYLSPQDIPIEN